MTRLKTVGRFLLSMLYMRFLFFFAFAYPVSLLSATFGHQEDVSSMQPLSFESFFPSSSLTKMLSLCMQAYGDLLAMRSSCGQQPFASTSALSLAAYEKLEELDVCLQKCIRQERLRALEDVEFLLAVLEKMERVCQVLILCSPSDEGLSSVETKIKQLQAKFEMVLVQAG